MASVIGSCKHNQQLNWVKGRVTKYNPRLERGKVNGGDYCTTFWSSMCEGNPFAKNDIGTIFLHALNHSINIFLIYLPAFQQSTR